MFSNLNILFKKIIYESIFTLYLETITEKVCRLVVHLTDSVHPEDLRTDSVQVCINFIVLLLSK